MLFRSPITIDKFLAPYPRTFEDITNRIADLCSQPGKKFIYSYWSEPDTTMHRKGCYSEESKQLLQDIESRVEKMCSGLDKTLFIITADHGHIALRPSGMDCKIVTPTFAQT